MKTSETSKLKWPQHQKVVFLKVCICYINDTEQLMIFFYLGVDFLKVKKYYFNTPDKS